MWSAADEWLQSHNPLRLFDLAGALPSDDQLRRLIGGVTGLLADELPAKYRADAVAAAEALAAGATRHPAVTRLRAELARGAKLPPRVRRVLSFVAGGLNDDLRVAARTRLEEVLSSPPVCARERVEAAMRCALGDPFRPVHADPTWRTADVLALARGIRAEKALDRLPILADALQDAECNNEDVLNHCRGDGPHVRGCWVVDLILGSE